MSRHRGGVAGKMLVVLQVSLCMLLLVCAGLFVRTLANLNALDPGFNKRGLLLFAIEPRCSAIPPLKTLKYYIGLRNDWHRFPRWNRSRSLEKPCLRKADQTAISCLRAAPEL